MSLAQNLSFLVNGYEIADALKGFTIECDSEEIDASVIANDFRSYEQGFKSGSVNATGIFDHDATLLDKIHDIFADAFTNATNMQILAYLGSTALGSPVVALTGAEVKYEIGAPLGQLITSNANFRTIDGISFALSLLSAQLNVGTTNGSSIDNTVATSNGGTLQVHLHNDDATNVLVKLQSSTNNSTWVDVTGGSVTGLSADNDSGIAVVATGVTINRWIRAVAVVTGGDTFLVSAAFERR